jgi:hypothetical protein
MKKVLFWVGLLCIVEGVIIGAMEPGSMHFDPHDPWQYSLAGMEVGILRTRQSLESQFGSFFGGLGMWLLCGYLKLKEAERQIIELRGQLVRLSPTFEKPPEAI